MSGPSQLVGVGTTAESCIDGARCGVWMMWCVDVDRAQSPQFLLEVLGEDAMPITVTLTQDEPRLKVTKHNVCRQ